MVAIPFWAAELGLMAAWVLVRAALGIRRKQIRWRREAALLLMLVNLAVLLRFTFFPMSLADGHVQPLWFDASAVFPFRVNWIPFAHLFDFSSRRDLLLNVVGNVAMFIPTGILLTVLDRRTDRFWKVVCAGALLSLGIELLQLPFSVRASDVDDLLLNTLGVTIGGGIMAMVPNRNKKPSHAVAAEKKQK